MEPQRGNWSLNRGNMDILGSEILRQQQLGNLNLSVVRGLEVVGGVV